MSQARSLLPRFHDVAAFQEWAAAQPGDWELHDGIPVAMAPERADHVRIKQQAWVALREALRQKDVRCEALIDGLAVPGPGLRRFRPDVVVSCGERLDGDSQTVDQPVILVEVLSPSTEDVDTGIKLESYLALPSVQHYLVISSITRSVIHHRRWDDGEQFLTAIRRTGVVELDPPGISIRVEDLYSGTNLDVG